MAQAYSFQRSDTVPRESVAGFQSTGALSSPGSSPQATDQDTRSWGVHGHISEQFQGFHASGNSLVNLAAELLAVLTTMAQQQQPTDPAEFREKLVVQISVFSNQGRLNGIPRAVMDHSSYLLCAALDESINSTPWGQACAWENHSLLSRLFQQRNGGEVFFVLLEQALQQPEPNAELLELIYILLRLGFQGRYRQQGSHNHSHELTRLTSDLYDQLRTIRPAPPERPAVPSGNSWRPLKQFRRRPWLVLVPLLLLAGYTSTHGWINHYNQNQPFDFQHLQNWTRPSQSGGAVYNSTADDLEPPQL